MTLFITLILIFDIIFKLINFTCFLKKKYMKLYKYKSLSNFELVADIFINKRLFAAKYDTLNDPMEGFFDKSDVEENYSKEIRKELKKIRVFSMSKEMNNPLLWAHYADSFKGICIEIDIVEEIWNIHKVNYSGFDVIPLKGYRNLIGTEEKMSTHDWAISSLKAKYKQWEYEEEYRILSKDEYLTKGFKIKAVYFGSRTSDTYKDLIRNLLPSKIKAIDTIITNHGLIKIIEY